MSNIQYQLQPQLVPMQAIGSNVNAPVPGAPNFYMGHATQVPPAPPPRDHIVWSLFNFIYMNMCCFGLVALIYSVKARDRKLAQDVESALLYGTTARNWNIIACFCTIIFSMITFFLLLTAARGGL